MHISRAHNHSSLARSSADNYKQKLNELGSNKYASIMHIVMNWLYRTLANLL